jgi:hypothetical protein
MMRSKEPLIVQAAIFKATLETFADVIEIHFNFACPLIQFFLDCEFGGILHGSHEIVHLILETHQIQSCKILENLRQNKSCIIFNKINRKM